MDTQTLTRITAILVTRYPMATPKISSLVDFGHGYLVTYFLHYHPVENRTEHMVAHLCYRDGELYTQFDLPVFTEVDIPAKELGWV